MDKHSIIQWNCRGLKANYNEVLILLTLLGPNVLCLQETFLKVNDKIDFKNYSIYNFINEDCQRASGGASIVVNNKTPHCEFKIDTNLQAVAVSVSFDVKVTICSVYVPPAGVLIQSDLDKLIDQLPKPFFLLGDFNGHNQLWGCNDLNNKGQILENFIINNDICLLNDTSFTYLHPATGNYSSLDLSMCHPSVFSDYEWSVLDDQYGSDHFPILIQNNSPHDREDYSKWKFNKADWAKYDILCREKINSDTVQTAENPVEYFNDRLLEIAKECIPKTSTNPKRSKPWYNEECKTAIKNRKTALHKFNKNPTKENLNNIKICRAKAPRTIKNAKENHGRHLYLK